MASLTKKTQARRKHRDSKILKKRRKKLKDSLKQRKDKEILLGQ